MPTTIRALGFTSGIQRLIWSGPPATITAYLWGGGGGRGGSDAASQGGNGTGGGYATYTHVITNGDVLDVAIGGGGGNGQSGVRASGGGPAGASASSLLFNTRTTTANPPVQAAPYQGYGSFLNTYGVWNVGFASSVFSRTYTVNFPTSATYTFSLSVDTFSTVTLDGTPVISLPDRYDSSNYLSSKQVTAFVTAGDHTIGIQAETLSGFGSVALTIGSTAGFSGGRGGNAGFSGSSGGGGGGGGATVLFVNGTISAAAGGGGGGGGAGLRSGGQSAPGSAGNDATPNGQNGQDHPGDGGGGGGGGGGWSSGNGGACGIGDNGGRGGSFGLSSAPGENPVGTTPGGTGSPYYRSGIAQGATASQSSTGGYAVIVIETSGTNINNNGTFYSVKNTYVKDSGVWKEVKTIWVKDGGLWKPVDGGVPPLFNTVPNTIGVDSRLYI